MYKKYSNREGGQQNMRGPAEDILVRAGENYPAFFQRDGGNQAGGNFRVATRHEGLSRSPC